MPKPTPAPKTKADRRRKRHGDLTAKGLCYRCGEKAVPGGKTCTACLDKQRAIYAARRAAGVCYCGRPRAEGRNRCAACLQRNLEAGAIKRAAHRAAGKCPCGQRKRLRKRTCVECARRNRELSERHRKAGLCRCGRFPPVDGFTACRLCRDRSAATMRRLRETAVRGYGGKCVCCGEDDPNVLELDHVNSDGTAHRRQVRGTTGIYYWAIRNNFPDRLQLLCASCHTARTRTGDCTYRRELFAKRGWL